MTVIKDRSFCHAKKITDIPSLHLFELTCQSPKQGEVCVETFYNVVNYISSVDQFAFSDIMAASANVYEEDMEEEEEEVRGNRLNYSFAS